MSQNSSDTLAKLTQIIGTYAKGEENRRLLDAALAASGLRAMRVPTAENFPVIPADNEETFRIGLLDTETTGFDAGTDKIIEIGLVPVLATSRGIVSVEEPVSMLEDPGSPLSEDVVRVTGLTDEILKGKRFDRDHLKDVTSGMSKIVCHNSKFDRRFVENNLPDLGLADIDWACSMAEVDWKARGHSKTSLEMLCLKEGFVYDAHRAVGDCLAMGALLNTSLNEDGHTAFAEMLATNARPSYHIFADRAPFSGKDTLKNDDYSWCTADDEIYGFSKVWHKPVGEDDLDAQRDLLRSAYGREASVPMMVQSARDRFSDRPGERKTLETKPSKDVNDLRDQTLAL